MSFLTPTATYDNGDLETESVAAYEFPSWASAFAAALHLHRVDHRTYRVWRDRDTHRWHAAPAALHIY